MLSHSSWIINPGTFLCLSVCQFDVRSRRPGRQVLQSPGHHDHLLLPLDHLCCRGCGHRHGVHHPSRWSCSEGGLRGQQEAHDQLCRRPAGPNPVRNGWKMRWNLKKMVSNVLVSTNLWRSSLNKQKPQPDPGSRSAALTWGFFFFFFFFIKCAVSQGLNPSLVVNPGIPACQWVTELS